MDSQIVFNTQSGLMWDWRVALDLFLGGIGVGTYLFAVWLDWRFAGKYRRICQTAAWLAPIAVLAGLEQSAITLVAPGPRDELPSIVHALRARRARA
jgi:formate-dependent nitrite reductase membrane component NrfD